MNLPPRAAARDSQSLRKRMRSISGWRLNESNDVFPVEQVLYPVFVRVSRHKTQADMLKRDQTSGATPHSHAPA